MCLGHTLSQSVSQSGSRSLSVACFVAGHRRSSTMIATAAVAARPLLPLASSLCWRRACALPVQCCSSAVASAASTSAAAAGPNTGAAAGTPAAGGAGSSPPVNRVPPEKLDYVFHEFEKFVSFDTSFWSSLPATYPLCRLVRRLTGRNNSCRASSLTRTPTNCTRTTLSSKTTFVASS